MKKQELSKHLIKYFRKRIDFLRKHCWNETENELTIEGIILVCSYIDSLSGYKYGGESTQDRFVRLINEYSGRKEIFEKISLVELYDAIKQGRIQVKQKGEVLDHLKRMGVHKEAYLDLEYNVDVTADECLNRLKDLHLSFDDHRTIINAFKGCKYSSILWKRYRCLAIHETRVDEGWNLGEVDLPYYITEAIYGKDGTSENKIRFGFPHKLIMETLEECLNNLDSELTENEERIKTRE